MQLCHLICACTRWFQRGKETVDYQRVSAPIITIYGRICHTWPYVAINKHMVVSPLLVLQRPPRTQLFWDRIFSWKLIENRSYWTKSDETWSESYRVGRSGAIGRHPKARFGPKQAKKSKIQKIKKLGAGAVPYIFLYIIQYIYCHIYIYIYIYGCNLWTCTNGTCAHIATYGSYKSA